MDPNVKKITRVARRCMHFGLAFLAVGLLISGLSLTSPSGRAESGAIVIFGGVPALFGAIFMCFRFGVILDRQRRIITTWWGLLVPFHKTEHPFSQMHYVTLSHERRGHGKSRYEVFPMRLEGADADAITLYEQDDYDKARRLAEEIAKFLHLGIRDRHSGEEVVRDAGTLDESIRQRAKRLSLTSRMPVQPPDARSSVSFAGSPPTATIDIPPLMHWAWFVLGGIVAWIIVSSVFIGLDFMFLFLPLLFMLAAYSAGMLHRERLVVSPDELVLTRRGIFGTNTIRLQANEIEEVEITRVTTLGVAGRIVVRSDRGSVEFGAVRSEEERKWLRDVLVHVLTSASP